MRNKHINLQNWSLLSYTGALYNILQHTDGGWSINISLFLTQKHIKNDLAVVLPLDLYFKDYISAFEYLQQMDYIFTNTLPDVMVINKDGTKACVLNLEAPPPEHELLPKPKFNIFHHAGNQTIN